jgi:hypothetical protein
MAHLSQRSQPKVVMFYRDFRFLTGGHVKVWDYFEHVGASVGYSPRIRFSRSSVMDATNPWSQSPEAMARRGEKADVYFVAGLDWSALPADRRRRGVPVINLVQHVRHADPEDPRRKFLRNPAVRVCVSPEVTAALSATGEVRGPLLTIPNGIDLSGFDQSGSGPPAVSKDLDLLISGIKQRDLARSIASEMSGAQTTLVLTERLPRAEYLGLLARARVALLLPGRTEGFYLPALEAMALGALVVCPDCVGNRSFCVDMLTAWRPAYQRDEIIAATHRALVADDSRAAEMRAAAADMAQRHSLGAERTAFHAVLDRLPELWEDALRFSA